MSNSGTKACRTKMRFSLRLTRTETCPLSFAGSAERARSGAGRGNRGSPSGSRPLRVGRHGAGRRHSCCRHSCCRHFCRLGGGRVRHHRLRERRRRIGKGYRRSVGRGRHNRGSGRLHNGRSRRRVGRGRRSRCLGIADSIPCDRRAAGCDGMSGDARRVRNGGDLRRGDRSLGDLDRRGVVDQARTQSFNAHRFAAVRGLRLGLKSLSCSKSLARHVVAGHHDTHAELADVQSCETKSVGIRMQPCEAA